MRDLLKKIDNILLEDSRKETNFEVDDLQKLNDIEDLDTLKKAAFTLISTPSKKRMKDEKISWFKRQLEKMTSKDRIIKMMWDLYLSGEGDSVIGSRYSTDRNYYRKVFDDLEENSNPRETLEMILQKLEREIEWPLTDIMDPKQVRELLRPLVRAVNDKMQSMEEQSVVEEQLEETYSGNDFYENYGELPWFEDEELEEAEYQGRKVKLGKPMRGDVKKFKVYVRNPKGNVVKVNFGDPNMRIKKSNPERRKSFRARHNCDNPGPRHKARYWSCRAW